MAIRVLRDHDVPEENIIFLTFLAAPAGLHVLSHAFPKIKIVTSMVDPALSPETLWIEPGIGNFGGLFLFNFYPLMLHLYILTSMSLLDRYYGTEED
jgi:uracil phosphoribosyltransferase